MGATQGRPRVSRGRRLAAAAVTAGMVLVLAPTTSVAAPNANANPKAHAASAGSNAGGNAGGANAGGAACGNRNNNTYDKLLGCVTVEGAMEHMRAFQAIADRNDGTRVSGTSGYDESAAYVVERMEAAGYDVYTQEFEFPFFVELSEPALERVSPNPTSYLVDEDFSSMTYSGAGDVTATATPVDIPPTGVGSGCEASDFAGFPAGDIALIQRGGCFFQIKAENAEAAGAVGAIVFNNDPDPTVLNFGTLGEPTVTIPVVTATGALGTELANATVRLTTDTLSETRTTVNVFAETPGGRDDNVVMVGAHLDSVYAGPGIHDNGSGSAALLEVAENMSKVQVENKVRFAWWGAEEFGLLGSDHYVYTLSDEERENIALYLNFDMIASPNYVRFIYDGDGSAFGLQGPAGSQQIEALYEDFYAARGLAWEPTEISFRSDYAAFFDFGIPFGGLFTGAEGIKTPEEQAIYGGTAGEQYDPCYHQPCDTIDNLNLEVFDLNLDAVAFSVLTYAYSTETVNGVVGRKVPGPKSHVFGARSNAPAGAGTHTHSGGGGLHPERDPDADHDHHHHPYDDVD
jgi:Zn-dependent M28 family amino/carboxypeptidase